MASLNKVNLINAVKPLASAMGYITESAKKDEAAPAPENNGELPY